MLTAYARTLAADLREWCGAQTPQLAFFVAEDPMRPYFILAGGGHRGGCCILSIAGTRPLSTRPLRDVEDAEYDVFVGKARDLRADPGAWMLDAETVTGAKPMLQLVEDVRARLMTAAFQAGTDEAAVLQPRGISAVTLPGTDIPLPAYRVSVELAQRVGFDDDADFRLLSVPPAAPEDPEPEP